MDGVRLLVVEDEDLVAEALVLVLKHLGYRVVATAKTGADAIELAERLEPQLILMDVRLPGELDGIETAELIRARLDVPIVYLSAHRDRQLLERAKKTEPYGYLAKPVKADALQAAIEMALHKHQMDRRGRESEQRLELALRGANLGLVDLNLLTDEIRSNSLFTEILGYPLDEIPRQWKDFESLIHPQDKGRVIQAWDAHVAGQTDLCETEQRTVTKSGEWRWIQARVKIIDRDKNGKPSRVSGVFLDVTRQKRLEQELRDSRERFRRMVETATEGIWELDADGKTSFVNSQTAGMLGYAVQEMTSRYLVEFVNAEWKPLAEFFWERCRKGILRADDFKFVRKDGSEVWVILSATPVFDENGVFLGGLVMLTDITERKLSEDALARSHEDLERKVMTRTAQLRLANEMLREEIAEREQARYHAQKAYRLVSEAQRIARLGSWEWNAATNAHEWSEEVFKILGVSKEAFVPTRQAFLQLVHPQDRELVEKSLADALKERKPYSIDHRIIRPDGEERMVRGSAEVVWDERGKPIGMIGGIQDVTEARRAQD